MKILVGIDHELVRSGLIQLLKDIHNIESMVIAPSIEELIDALRTYEFDLIVTDVSLQGAGGLKSILFALEPVHPETKRVFMYKEPTPELNNLMNDKIIHGIFYEKSSLDDLMFFFQKVFKGEYPVLSSDKKDHMSYSANVRNDLLTTREEEILHMKVRGYTVKETADILNISPKTIENHRRNIKKKLKIDKSSEWVDWGKKFRMI
ncbi:response regulator transcription factor [Bacillus shivajii]|uniref:response regulator transcription factor n=1 Tax=Bacillus shivajii TaxID=1983719 RepID=UPI001CFA0522|nr:response regulator transcription factor [Bacillus shivajii]UCZ52594.1 response regulator transcription factor [Bacillus shivajii]